MQLYRQENVIQIRSNLFKVLMTVRPLQKFGELSSAHFSTSVMVGGFSTVQTQVLLLC